MTAPESLPSSPPAPAGDPAPGTPAPPGAVPAPPPETAPPPVEPPPGATEGRGGRASPARPVGLTTPRFEAPIRQSLLRDFWQFIREEKLWWMIPLGLVLLLFVVLLLGAQNSALAAFLYPLF